MILITGAAGYIGSHFVRYYLSKPNASEVVAVDDLSEGHIESLPKDRVHFVRARIQDEEEISRVLDAYSIDAVVHFAASAYVGESQEKPFKYFENNVTGTLELLKMLDKRGIKKLVFSSSCATYGNPNYLPLDENHTQEPVSVYGTTKLIVEEALNALHLATGWSYVSLRYFNAAGADDAGDIGESHDPETHLIPLALKAALGKVKELKVFGDDYDTRDGTCIRDYVHVNDLAEAHCLALDKMESAGPIAYKINLGTASGVSVREIIDACQKVTGLKVPVNMTARRPGDATGLYANCSLAEELLGWKPKYNLERIIETAFKWEQNQRY